MTGHDVWADSLQSKLFEEEKSFLHFFALRLEMYSLLNLKTIFQLSENQTEIVFPFGNFYRTFCISVRKQSMMRSTLPQKPSTRRRRWVLWGLGGSKVILFKVMEDKLDMKQFRLFLRTLRMIYNFYEAWKNMFLDIVALLLVELWFNQVNLFKRDSTLSLMIIQFGLLPTQTFNYVDSDGTYIISKENFLEEDTKWAK